MNIVRLPSLQSQPLEPPDHVIYCYSFDHVGNPWKSAFGVNIPGKYWRRKLTELRDVFAQFIENKWGRYVDPATLELWKVEDCEVDVADHLQTPADLMDRALYKKLSDLKTPENFELEDVTWVAQRSSYIGSYIAFS
ncbi:hypothetical protein AX16_003324 [Volvariella volvacea WC 439]|nr:hypothetical protein AX16_003324 [Volvariella volvacea WC 439]